MNFDWDEDKNKVNIKKHGVDFRDACYVFADAFALNMPAMMSTRKMRKGGCFWELRRMVKYFWLCIQQELAI
jgi:uncharacterized DUF497 family protein